MPWKQIYYIYIIHIIYVLMFSCVVCKLLPFLEHKSISAKNLCLIFLSLGFMIQAPGYEATTMTPKSTAGSVSDFPSMKVLTVK